MKRLLYLLLLLLAVFPLRAEEAADWIPDLPPDPGATFTLVLEDEPYEVAELIGGGIYKDGATVSINCLPQEGYRFVRWTLDGELFATTAQYSFSMPEDNIVLVAELETLTKHHLALSVEPAAAAVLNGEGDYYPGTAVSISCTMDEDYTFIHWTKNGTKYSENKDLLYTMEDTDVAFVAVCQYTPNGLISIESADEAAGVVSSKGGRYAVGEQLEFVATPNRNFIFSHWELNGSFYSDKAVVNYTVVNEDVRFVAVFEFMPVQPDDPSMELTSVVYIEAQPAGAATFNVQSGTRYNEGDTVLIQAQLRSNYELIGWYVNDVCVATSPVFMYVVGYSDATIVLRAKQIVNRKLTLQASPQNTVQFNIASPTTVKEGAQVALQANVLPDYTFKGWYEGTTLLSNDLAFVYTMPTRDVTLTAMAEETNPEEWIPSLPSDPDMDAVFIEVLSANTTMGKTAGSADYAIGATITIKAIPNTGYHFVKWNDGNTDAIRTLEVTDAATYVAEFAANQYSIQVLANSNAMGTTTGSGTYAYRSTATIKATAKTGYKFEQWSDNNTSATRSILVTSDSVFTAQFAPITMKLNVVSSNTAAGTVTGDGAYMKGDSVTITATANHGYNFVRWSDGNTDPIRIIVVSQDNATYTAYFVAQQMQLTLHCNDYAMGYLLGEGSYPYASNVNIAAKPYAGYEFVRWSDGNTNASRTISLTDNTTLTAWFQTANKINDVVTLCPGEEYLWHGEFYNTTGVYVSNAAGETDTLFLTVLPTSEPTIEKAEICQGESYTWRGKSYTRQGSYNASLKNQYGCDSLVVLQLTVHRPATTTDSVTVCDSYTWTDGLTYTESGEYIQHLQTVHGCDSTAVLVLTVNKGNTVDFTITACDSYEWHSEVYTKSGDYTYLTQTTNGCDSLEVLHLTINATKHSEETVVACDSYTWNGENYTKSGDYTYTTVAANGCDSVVTLHLTINYADTVEYTETACDSFEWHGEVYTQSGEYTYLTQTALGCDSLEVLHLTINATKHSEETVVACDSYTWNGVNYTKSGDYTYTTTASNGCDSIVTLHLTINATKYAEETVVACDSYSWNGASYTKSGDYTYTTTASNGCDSVVTLHLTINYADTVEYTATACDSYEWHDEVYTQSGEYTYLTQTALGCDSLEVLHLTINATKYADETVSACDSYTWNGKNYTKSGDYTYTTVAANGCDSVVTLHLTINATKYAEETVVACDSYSWNGVNYTKSGDYTYTTVAANGCDSVVTLHLTINTTKYSEEIVSACDSYSWNGVNYTKSGDYTYTTVASNGCDSIATLHLTINATKYADETVSACDSYSWNGESHTESGEYTFTTTASNGCDSIVTLHLTINTTKYSEETVSACDSYSWNGVNYTKSGDYTYTTVAANGCDSVVTLHLTINYADTVEYTETACDSFEWHGEVYTQSGEYTYLTQTTLGCDSLEVLHLTINATKYAEETVVACDSYSWNGESYTESGNYTYTTVASNGCDSIVTLHLTINATKYSEETVSACDSYSWNGESYTESGDYTYTTVASNGCDSIVTLHLTINATKYAEETVVACDSYSWNGESYTESRDYTFTTTAVNGCDSIVTLHLTINASVLAEEEYATVCYGETYTWNDAIYSESGDYTISFTTTTGCDSVATLHLVVLPATIIDTEEVTICTSEWPYIWNGQEITEVGTYTFAESFVATACDSIVHVLNLQTYVQTLPDVVTQPIVNVGKPIDVTISDEEIMEHIQAETWYAPEAFVEWYIKYNNTDWQPLTYTPVANVRELWLKYEIITECGSVEGEPMYYNLLATPDENLNNETESARKVIYEGKVVILRDGKIYNMLGMEINNHE